jgi:hypothetical protein
MIETSNSKVKVEVNSKVNSKVKVKVEANSDPDPNKHIKEIADALKNSANIHGDNHPAVTKSFISITNNISPHVVCLLLTTLDVTFLHRARNELTDLFIGDSKQQFDKHQDEKKKQPPKKDFFSNLGMYSGKWGDIEDDDDDDDDDDCASTPPNDENKEPDNVFDRTSEVRDKPAEWVCALKRSQKENRRLRKENRRLQNLDKPPKGASNTFANSVGKLDPTPSESGSSSRSSHRSPPLPAGTKWQKMPTGKKSKNSGVAPRVKTVNKKPGKVGTVTSFDWWWFEAVGKRDTGNIDNFPDCSWFRCEGKEPIGWPIQWNYGDYTYYKSHAASKYTHRTFQNPETALDDPDTWEHFYTGSKQITDDTEPFYSFDDFLAHVAKAFPIIVRNKKS